MQTSDSRKRAAEASTDDPRVTVPCREFEHEWADINFLCRRCGVSRQDVEQTAPAAPVSEPLCRCGHANYSHWSVMTTPNRNPDCCVGGCRCKRFTPPVPVSDEAEAAEAWHQWVLDEEPALPPEWWDITRRAVAAGFRAARQAGKDEQP